MVQSSFFCFYSTPVYGGLLDVDPDLLEDMANNPEKYEPATMKLTEFLLRTITGGQALDKFFGTSSQELISNIKALFSKEGNCKTDGNNYYLTQNFVNEFNTALQDKVHALDGYYLVEPEYSYELNTLNANTGNRINNYDSSSYEYVVENFNKYTNCYHWYTTGNDSCYNVLFFNANYLYMGESEIMQTEESLTYSKSICYVMAIGSSSASKSSYIRSLSLNDLKNKRYLKYGSPFKVFYSKEDLKRYLNNGKQRIYAPKLPSTTISIPIKYINNSVSLPDITYNINTTNKTEVEIQNEYNTTLNNYLNDLNKFSDGGSGNTPTPTPSGGGSGDFGDSTTPTPKPDFGDGSDLTDTNDWLKKIYEWLQSFGDTHSKFEKTITDYIEANNGKLDQIIEAINALSDGKTEDEKNGCKYDFTALSDFMTKLWNESDKKFDKMVELLEENNKYQKKLVNSLNEIKAILVTQTIMDVFQDRSQQTAEKAKDKFPTSLPWDIALVVNAMSAEPEKPQFNLPIQIKSLNINEEIHVDLASGEWEKLAKTCRYLLSILFILLLVQLSRKLFSNGGND